MTRFGSYSPGSSTERDWMMMPLTVLHFAAFGLKMTNSRKRHTRFDDSPCVNRPRICEGECEYDRFLAHPHFSLTRSKALSEGDNGMSPHCVYVSSCGFLPSTLHFRARSKTFNKQPPRSTLPSLNISHNVGQRDRQSESLDRA